MKYSKTVSKTFLLISKNLNKSTASMLMKYKADLCSKLQEDAMITNIVRQILTISSNLNLNSDRKWNNHVFQKFPLDSLPAHLTAC